MRQELYKKKGVHPNRVSRDEPAYEDMFHHVENHVSPEL